jgi:arylsulfatase A-like enzyme
MLACPARSLKIDASDGLTTNFKPFNWIDDHMQKVVKLIGSAIPPIRIVSCAIVWTAAWLFASAAWAEAPARPNFLFIAVDDLNDFSGYVAEEPGNFLQVIYPDAKVRGEVCKHLTPNLDKLARRSAPFARAYCPSALCGPSRTSLMTGVAPHRSGYYTHERHFRTFDTLKDAVTLPQQLKANGYFTTGLGKLFHKSAGNVDGPIGNDWADARDSWSVWLNHATGCNGGAPDKYSPPNGGNMVFGRSRLPIEKTGDWLAADFAARLLEHGEATMKPEGRRGKSGATSVKLPSDQPFFLGCGLFRPHLPFYAPSEFFELFPTEQMTGLNRKSLERIVADLDDLPPGAVRFSDFTNGKMRVVMDHAKSLGSGEEVAAWRAMVQSYLACVAYADACLGRLIDGYEKSPQHDNTILFLWSDHGYHLGSKYHVAKQALWEEANRVQFIVHDPRKPDACNGELRRQIVSLNDLYPTICELAGTEVGPQVEVGRSIVSLINDANAEPVHDYLLMTYQPGNHSIRTATHKLNRYRDGSLELYNMIRDPAQRDNLAGQPAAAEIQSKLQQALDKEIPASDF